MSRILIVSESAKGRDFFESLILKYGEHEIFTADDSTRAKEILQLYDPELVIVNAPHADGKTGRLAAHAAQNFSCGIMMVMGNEVDERDVIRMEKLGALVIRTPVSQKFFYRAFRLALACRMRIAQFQKEKVKLERRIEDIGVVSRAKCILIEVLGMTEAQAHRYIERQAMDLRMTRRQVAEKLLETYE